MPGIHWYSWWAKFVGARPASTAGYCTSFWRCCLVEYIDFVNGFMHPYWRTFIYFRMWWRIFLLHTSHNTYFSNRTVNTWVIKKIKCWGEDKGKLNIKGQRSYPCWCFVTAALKVLFHDSDFLPIAIEKLLLLSDLVKTSEVWLLSRIICNYFYIPLFHIQHNALPSSSRITEIEKRDVNILNK